MLEHRASARQLTFRTGRIAPVDESNQIDCAILNISQSGACILVPDGAEIPECFELAIDSEHAIRLCRRVWRDGFRIGVAFLHGGQKASHMPG
jgi:PilZ domain-containing protein